VRTAPNPWKSIVALVVPLLVLPACSVHFLGSHVREAEAGLRVTHEQVEQLLDAVGDRAPGDRAYGAFAQRYTAVLAQLRAQMMREALRPLNAESCAIVARLEATFAEYRARHPSQEDYPDSLIAQHRANVRVMFSAALRGERLPQERRAADSR
jgi:hypothetical protein